MAPAPPSSPPLSSPPAPLPIAEQIVVGQRVERTFTATGARIAFALTAQEDGILIVNLSWQGTWPLELRVGNQFGAGSPASELTARVPVTAGSVYTITVADGDPWDSYDLHVPYVLTTSLQR